MRSGCLRAEGINVQKGHQLFMFGHQHTSIAQLPNLGQSKMGLCYYRNLITSTMKARRNYLCIQMHAEANSSSSMQGSLYGTASRAPWWALQHTVVQIAPPLRALYHLLSSLVAYNWALFRHCSPTWVQHRAMASLQTLRIVLTPCNNLQIDRVSQIIVYITFLPTLLTQRLVIIRLWQV